MTDLSDMPEIDDLNIRDGDYGEINVKVSGIDLRKLNQGEESQFEVEPPEPCDENTTTNNYFEQELLFQQLNYDCINEGNDENDKMTPFERIKKDMVDLSGDGGVLKSIRKHGAGPVVPSKSLCRVHYNAYLEYSDEPFDSSRLRAKQHQFKLGVGDVLLGWEIGVATMKRGELAQFMLQPYYAYGKMGCPPRIPADATILFEIELISFVDQSATEDFENFSEEERRNASFEQILQVVDALRKSGNEAFGMNQIRRAYSYYNRALRLIENTNLKNEHEENLMKQSSLKLYLNLSLCDIKDAKSGRACKNARKALDIDPKNTKALYRLARALHQLGELQEAKRQLYKAHKLNPGSEEIKKELKVLDAELQSMRQKDEALSRKMLSLNPIPKPTKKTAVPSPAINIMLNLVIERLQTFKDAEDMCELSLPNTLTDDEIEHIEEVAKNMNLVLNMSMKDEQKCIVVSKNGVS